MTKRKSIFAYVLALCLVVPAMFVLTACGNEKHKHTYSNEWSADNTHHWYSATCEHTEEKDSYGEHAVETWTTKTSATYGQNEILEGECTVCHKQVTRENADTALEAKSNVVTISTIDFTYSGVAKSIDSLITADNKVGMVIKYSGTDGTEYAETTTAPTNAGTYNYAITIPATSEWKEYTSTGKFTIKKFQLKEYEKKHTKVYDKSNQLAVYFKSFTGKDMNLQLVVNSANAGTYDSVPSVVINGPDNANYEIDKSKVKLEITKKTLNTLNINITGTISESDDSSQTYEYTLTEADGVIAGETVKIIITYTDIDVSHEGSLSLVTDTPGQGQALVEFEDAKVNYTFNNNIGAFTKTAE